MGEPFCLGAVDTHDHPRLADTILEIGAVENTNGGGDRGGVWSGASDAQEAPISTELTDLYSPT